jgi:hypothetical protein
MTVFMLCVLLLLLLAGCGDDPSEHYPASSILSQAEQNRVADAVERTVAVCSGFGSERLRSSAFEILTSVAKESPGGVFVSKYSNQTMVELLDDLGSANPDCGLGKDLEAAAKSLR